MIATIASVLTPVFALILLGYGGRKLDILGATAASELNRLVVWLCLPALIFESTALVDIDDIWQPDFILVFTLSTLAIFLLTGAWRLLKGCQTLAVASIDGLGASYANTGYVGIPICVLVFGDAGLQPAIIASLIVVCALFALAVVGVEVSRQEEVRLWPAVRKVSQALLKNPLVIAPLIGIGWNLSDLGVNDTLITLLGMLGDATIPCALLSLGAFLAGNHGRPENSSLTPVLVKLIAHPLLTWWLAYEVFQLPEFWAKSAVILAALPTGTGPYMLAEIYKTEPAAVSRTILLSTIGSLITLTCCLYWL